MVSKTFKKRGLPHCHILLILDDHDRLITPDFVDNVISAELPPSPDNSTNEEIRDARQSLEKIVLQNMIHDPVVQLTQTVPAWRMASAPKAFQKLSSKKQLLIQRRTMLPTTGEVLLCQLCHSLQCLPESKVQLSHKCGVLLFFQVMQVHLQVCQQGK